MYLGEVRNEKDKLEGKNDMLSQNVYENESTVQNSKAKVSAAYEQLKQKSKDLYLLREMILRK